MWKNGFDPMLDVFILLCAAVFGFYYIKTCRRVARRMAETLNMNELVCVLLSLSFTPWIMSIVIGKAGRDSNN
jgi:hypothetical protein